MISNVGHIGMTKAAEVVRIASALPYVKLAEDTLNGERLTAKEEANLAKTLEKISPKSPTEEKVQLIAGRPFTPGQYARYGAIGSGVGVLGHIAGSAVAGGSRWAPFVTGAEKAEQALMETAAREAAMKEISKDISKAVLHPRQLARAGIMGTAFGLGVPMLRRMSDIYAAREGSY